MDCGKSLKGFGIVGKVPAGNTPVPTHIQEGKMYSVA
jgi:hypothetical protein